VLKKDKDGTKVVVKWDQQYIHENEWDESTELLKRTQWNPEKPKNGAWREDLRHLRMEINE
jgi:hypothetical protein